MRNVLPTGSGLVLVLLASAALARDAHDTVRIRTLDGQMRKLPGSKPGMAILERSIAAAFVVDAFR